MNKLSKIERINHEIMKPILEDAGLTANVCQIMWKFRRECKANGSAELWAKEIIKVVREAKNG
jgi:hypothetical protein